jgi:hypothetical protein
MTTITTHEAPERSVRPKITITREIAPDENPDASYLEQTNFEERRAEYDAGYFDFVGVRAVAEIEVPYGQGWIVTTIESPGLWGIDPDSGEDYFAEVFDQERETLVEMLKALGDGIAHNERFQDVAVVLDLTCPVRSHCRFSYE